MAAMPLYWQPPPATALPQDSSYTPASAHSSFGPFIAVLIVVTVLCIIAGIIGRLCSGKTIMGYGDYDMERWAESRCASCIDGQILPQRSLPPLCSTSSGVSAESEVQGTEPDETEVDKQDSRHHEPPPPASSS